MELTRPADINTWHAKVVLNISAKFRSHKQYSEAAVAEQSRKQGAKLRKRNPKQHSAVAPDVDELGERKAFAIFEDQQQQQQQQQQQPATSHKQEKPDHGEMMHRLAHSDSLDSLVDKSRDPYVSSDPSSSRKAVCVSERDELRIALLPDEVWLHIASFLDPVSAARLALSSTTLHRKLGPFVFPVLAEPHNKHHRILLLHSLLDHRLPDHLLCFPCATYHLRLRPGSEVLKMIDYVSHPVFLCPQVRASFLPRMRLVHGRVLPYSFVQLALRHSLYSPSFGIDHASLARRFRCKDSAWTHRTRFLVHNNHLLLRVVSHIVTPPASSLTETAERHLLYDREEHTPFFSVCAHWRDGDLTKICKCMMSHVPAPPDPYHHQLRRSLHISRSAAHPHFLVTGCDFCRPARRCPECPTEYLVEIRMLEDPSDPHIPFKHALVVTRWADLGSGASPFTDPEWVAINGLSLPHAPEGAGAHAFDSFSHLGRRAIGGIFESAVSGEIPGQRLISLNPSNRKLGEDGHGWY